jgi:hypothetical protein
MHHTMVTRNSLNMECEIIPPCRWRQNVPVRDWYLSIKIHSITYRKVVVTEMVGLVVMHLTHDEVVLRLNLGRDMAILTEGFISFFIPSRQMPGYFLNETITVSFQILCSSLIIPTFNTNSYR